MKEGGRGGAHKAGEGGLSHLKARKISGLNPTFGKDVLMLA